MASDSSIDEKALMSAAARIIAETSDLEAVLCAGGERWMPGSMRLPSTRH
jgi:hypothetical protein